MNNLPKRGPGERSACGDGSQSLKWSNEREITVVDSQHLASNKNTSHKLYYGVNPMYM